MRLNASLEIWSALVGFLENKESLHSHQTSQHAEENGCVPDKKNQQSGKLHAKEQPHDFQMCCDYDGNTK